MSNNQPTVRVTQLSSQERTHDLWLIHPTDALFDICAFNASEGTNYQALPPPHPHGAPLDGASKPDAVLLDQTLLGQPEIQVWRGDTFETAALSELSGGHVVQACVPVRHPEDDEPDRVRVNNAISAFTELRIQQRLDETLEIPPLPEAARRIVALQSDPNYDLSDLVSIVETDPSIAAKIVSWANSAYYAANPPARSLDDAIMRILGFDLVLNLALGLVLSGTLRLPESAVRGAPPVWLEAVFTATAMEHIGRRLPLDTGPSPGSCYLTGLLANFGTLVVGHVFPPQFRTICRLQEANPHLPASVIDAHVLNLPREVIAAALLEQWELPDEIVTAIRHQGTEGYNGIHATWVNLLQVARKMLEGSLTGEPDALEETDLDSLGLKTPDLRAVSELLGSSQAELENLARAVA